MKLRRKAYRDRLQVLMSVEKQRWNDFMDLCDKERKSTSFKFNEMLEEELEKNAFGPVNNGPIKMLPYSKERKPIQRSLDAWLTVDIAIQSIKQVDPNIAHTAAINLLIAERFRRQRVITQDGPRIVW